MKSFFSSLFIVHRSAFIVSCIVHLLSFLFVVGTAWAEGNIDRTAKFAWSENGGWHNWRSTNGGVTVIFTNAGGFLSGYAWGENIGWVKLGAGAAPYANTATNNYGVNIDAAGRLTGYAWSETCGWISFCTTNSTDSLVPTR